MIKRHKKALYFIFSYSKNKSYKSIEFYMNYEVENMKFISIGLINNAIFFQTFCIYDRKLFVISRINNFTFYGVIS